MRATRIDIPRLIKFAALVCTVTAAAFVYIAYAPQIDALQVRIDDGRSELRSDDAAFNAATTLRGERTQLAVRYASLFAQNPEAVFVRELATTVRRHRVTLVATNVSQDANALGADATTIAFSRTHVSIELRGSYRTLLATIADLSMGSEIVEVREPGMHRDDAEIVATVPVVIYEPLHSARSSADRPGGIR